MGTPSQGGAFLPSADYVVTGQWTFTQDPNFGDTTAQIVTTSGTQTLTNKTLTSPTVNTPTVTNPTVTTGTFTAPAFVGYTDFVEQASTAAALTNYGLSTIAGTTTTRAFTLSAPLPGSIKRIATLSAGSTTLTTTVRCSTDGTITYDGTNCLITFIANGIGTAVLNAASTTRWIIAGSTALLSLST